MGLSGRRYSTARSSRGWSPAVHSCPKTGSLFTGRLYWKAYTLCFECFGTVYPCKYSVVLVKPEHARVSAIQVNTGLQVDFLRCNYGLSCSADKWTVQGAQTTSTKARYRKSWSHPQKPGKCAPWSAELSRLRGAKLQQAPEWTALRVAATSDEEDDWGAFWEAPRNLRELFLKITGDDHWNLEPQDGYRQPRSAAIRCARS